ncbi:MAG: dTDP-4-dehydrorhamnose 3,5-epimerase [Acidobacteriia bacterium]|nr:dTDP-4-dehydrorhamnose 3,5-epimerase [Terriglobia bacterium]
MNRIETSLPGVCLLQPRLFSDSRGFFLESYHRDKFAALGIADTFVQDNHSRSTRGVLRGLHYQLRHPQAKLCRVIEGEVLDVAVDVRLGSPTFGKSASVLLTAQNHAQIYIPAGFAHAFLVLSDSAQFLYKCSDFYDPADEHGILWNDLALNIPWGLSDPILSEKDRKNIPLAQVSPGLLPRYQP